MHELPSKKVCQSAPFALSVAALPSQQSDLCVTKFGSESLVRLRACETTMTEQSITQQLWDQLHRAQQIVQRFSITAFEYGRTQATAANGTFKHYLNQKHRQVGDVAMQFDVLPDEPLLCETALSDMLAGFVQTQHDRNMTESRKTKGYNKRIRLEQRGLEELAARHHSQKLMLPLTIKLSIDALRECRSAPWWRIYNKLRYVYSKSATQAICLEQAGYQPPLQDGFVMCKEVKLVVKDNKEFMQNMVSRLVNGERKTGGLLHCVTGELVPIPKPILADVLPQRGDKIWLPSHQQVSLADKFPMSQTTTDAWLGSAWKDYVNIYLGTKCVEKLLERPPPECDQWTHGRQVSFHEKIFMNTGTSESKDIKKVMDDLLERDSDCFWMLGGDQQTVRNAWTIMWADEEKYRNFVIVPGGLHEQMHDCQATGILGWTYHLEPVCLLTGSLKVHTAKFYAKEHNEKQRLILLTLACGTKYLADSDIDVPTLLSHTRLLTKLKRNEPLHDFIFWMVYCALPYRVSLNATRCSDNTTKDMVWRYNMFKYAATGKKNYKLLTLMFGQVPHPPFRN